MSGAIQLAGGSLNSSSEGCGLYLSSGSPSEFGVGVPATGDIHLCMNIHHIHIFCVFLTQYDFF